MSVNADREIFVRTTIRELVIYIMFIGVLSIGEFLINFHLSHCLSLSFNLSLWRHGYIYEDYH